MTGYYVVELEWNSTRSLLPNHALCILKFITPMYIKDQILKLDLIQNALKEVSWQEQAICPWIKTRCVLLEKLPFTSLPLYLCRCVLSIHGEEAEKEGSGLIRACGAEVSRVCSTTSITRS